MTIEEKADEPTSHDAQARTLPFIKPVRLLVFVEVLILITSSIGRKGKQLVFVPYGLISTTIPTNYDDSYAALHVRAAIVAFVS
ncbi:hypothetical protein [Actinotignum urinale]|uniref:hypothetical protein n=1 Tax=Actinotignum urinale TaxID=190146 RepID=UPI0003B4BEB5|nr:hypothetical protein [Actinotignum urinale]MDY5159974.1 hypothetical protein [Actinotignum urinale]